MYRKFLLVFISLLMAVLQPYMALADAEAQVLEVKVNNSVIRVGYDQDKAGIGEPVPFAFELLQEDESAEMPFDSLWVNIKPKTNPNLDLLVVEVKKPALGTANITYDFPQTGEYTFIIRYNRNDEVLAEHIFDFVISKESFGQAGFSQLSNEITNKAIADTNNSMYKYLWIITAGMGLIVGWSAKIFIRKT